MVNRKDFCGVSLKEVLGIPLEELILWMRCLLGHLLRSVAVLYYLLYRPLSITSGCRPNTHFNPEVQLFHTKSTTCKCHDWSKELKIIEHCFKTQSSCHSTNLPKNILLRLMHIILQVEDTAARNSFMYRKIAGYEDSYLLLEIMSWITKIAPNIYFFFYPKQNN